MKLYATVTATKLIDGKKVTVSKGQGSNERLRIEITAGEERELMGTLNLFPRYDKGHYELSIIDRTGTCHVVDTMRIKKGEKKKGEVNCPVCDKPFINGTCKECDELVNSL